MRGYALFCFEIRCALSPTSSHTAQLCAQTSVHVSQQAVTMGRKRASMAPGDASGGEKSSKKSKKRRREGEQGGGSTGGERRTPSSKAVVLRCATEDSVNPLVVSFANQTVPKDMGAVEFRVHEAEDEEREGERMVLGDGGRWVL